MVAMTVGALGWLVISALFTHKVDSLRLKIAGSQRLMPVVTAGAMAGAFAYLFVDHYSTFNWHKIVAASSGYIIMEIFNILEEKRGLAWVKEWGITIAMLSGCVIEIVVFNVIL